MLLLSTKGGGGNDEFGVTGAGEPCRFVFAYIGTACLD